MNEPPVILKIDKTDLSAEELVKFKERWLEAWNRDRGKLRILPEARCPATFRHVRAHSLIVTGVQCKYAAGHNGDHAGYGGFGSAGDVFWPQEES